MWQQGLTVERSLHGIRFHRSGATKLKWLAPIVGYENRTTIRRTAVQFDVSQERDLSRLADVGCFILRDVPLLSLVGCFTKLAPNLFCLRFSDGLLLLM